MMTGWSTSSRRKRIVCAVLAAVLLAISAYVYSGFHQHEQRSNKVCSFSQFEGPSIVEAATNAELCPPSVARWRAPDAEAPCPQFLDGTRALGRAPPSC